MCRMGSRSSIRRSSLASQVSLSNRLTSKSAMGTSNNILYLPGMNKKNGVNCIPEEVHRKKRPKSTETIKFIYSMAVIKAFKRDYNVTQFGPPSAATLNPRHNIQICKLSELYDDFRMITELLENNQKYIEKLRKEMEAAGEIIPVPIARERAGGRHTAHTIKQYQRAHRGSRVLMTGVLAGSKLKVN